jgi:hypothetical protein
MTIFARVALIKMRMLLPGIGGYKINSRLMYPSSNPAHISPLRG